MTCTSRVMKSEILSMGVPAVEDVGGIVRQANRVPIRAGVARRAGHGAWGGGASARRAGLRGRAEQREEAALRRTEASALHRGRGTAGPAFKEQGGARLPIPEGGPELEHRGVDVGLAADGRGVAQAL